MAVRCCHKISICNSPSPAVSLFPQVSPPNYALARGPPGTPRPTTRPRGLPPYRQLPRHFPAFSAIVPQKQPSTSTAPVRAAIFFSNPLGRPPLYHTVPKCRRSERLSAHTAPPYRERGGESRRPHCPVVRYCQAQPTCRLCGQKYGGSLFSGSILRRLTKFIFCSKNIQIVYFARPFQPLYQERAPGDHFIAAGVP